MLFVPSMNGRISDELTSNELSNFRRCPNPLALSAETAEVSPFHVCGRCIEWTNHLDELLQVQFSLDIFRDMKRREVRSPVPESDESEPDTGSDSGSSDGSSAEYDEEDLNEDVSSAPSEVPLYMRLAEQNTDAAITAAAREKVQRRRSKDAAKGNAPQRATFTGS